MKRKVYGLIGLVALAAVGGTFAYYTSTDTFTNPFQTTNYGTSTTEKFNPDEANEWKPGATVDKKVTATNTGDGPVWVRVKFKEEWKRGEEDPFGQRDSGWDDFAFFPATTSNAGRGESNNLNDVNNISITKGDITEDYQKPTDIKEVGKDATVGETDGIVNADSGSVVYKNLSNVVNAPGEADETGSWYYNSNDGYFYYTKELAGKGAGSVGESTKTLLNSVTLCGNTDMGNFIEENYWLAVEKGTYKDTDPIYPEPQGQWQEGELNQNSDEYKELVKDQNVDVYWYKNKKLDTENQGYANAGYTLDIIVEYVQADEDGEAAQAFKAEDGTTWSWWPGKDS